MLIAGVYLPTIQAVHSLLKFQLAVLPGLCARGFGVLVGVGCSIHAIRTALQNHRSAMVWLILGLMLGSLYAIANGPAASLLAGCKRSTAHRTPTDYSFPSGHTLASVIAATILTSTNRRFAAGIQ